MIISTIRSTTWLADCILVALLLIAFKQGYHNQDGENNGVICEPKPIYYWSQPKGYFQAFQLSRSRSAG
jgi:hypothetical protein